MEPEDVRRSHSLDFKKTVLDYLATNNGNISDAARTHNISRKCVQRWKKEEETIRKSVKSRDTGKSRIVRRIRKKITPYPELDATVIAFIKKRRSEKKTVTTKLVCKYARSTFNELYPNSTTQFKASKGWFRRFRKRNSVSHRRVTSVGQKVPDDAPVKAEEFLHIMSDKRKYELYVNMDESPQYFDMPRNATFDITGVKSVKVKTTGYEKLRFTTVLSVGLAREGDILRPFRLPPMVMFKNLKKAPKGKFPPGVVVTGSKGGSMTTKFLVNDYIKVFKRRPGGFFSSKDTLLIMDRATSHTGEEVISKFTSLNTDIEYIDNGMTGLLQLVDTHLNKPVKDRLRDKWEEWMDEAEHSFTASGENFFMEFFFAIFLKIVMKFTDIINAKIFSLVSKTGFFPKLSERLCFAQIRQNGVVQSKNLAYFYIS